MDNPIGVLDSGVGGLTIWKEIVQLLPQESTVYIGDSLHAPYGKRTPEDIRYLASRLISFLVSRRAKLVVVACNTITVNGIEELRNEFPQIPIIGTVPVIKLAAKKSKNKKIGLLVTEATAKSKYNQNLIDTFAQDCDVITIGTNALVPLIESHNNQQLPQVIAEELSPFISTGVDTVILGSTHFPILKKSIQEFLGDSVQILDSGGAVARQVKRILTNNTILNASSKATHTLFTTGEKDPFNEILTHLIGIHPYTVKRTVLQYHHED